MQFLSIESVSKLYELADLVGDRNVDAVLVANKLSRSPNIKLQFDKLCKDVISNGTPVTPQQKINMLNKFTEDSDIFESAALLSNNDWKVLANLSTFPNYLYIPESIELANSASTLGNAEPIRTAIYDGVMTMLSRDPYTIDPGIFNEYSTIKNSQISGLSNTGMNNSYYWFPIPLGKVTLYSSLMDESIDIPAYPEEVEDSVKANYSEMPDLLYQYEPWYVYQSSGPRSNPYSFDLHRDMWSGDHRDGKANELIRFCQSCCYPEYNGSAVYSDIVTFYIDGNPLISGIMTDVTVNWDGPLLSDNWYGHFKLQFTITEISKIALNQSSVRRKPLIG